MNKKAPLPPKRIAIVGMEGAGKTVLTNQLKQHFQTFATFEYGFWYCSQILGGYYQHHDQQFLTQKTDFGVIIANTQFQMNQIIIQAQNASKSVCFFDTDLIFTKYFINLQFPEWSWINQFLATQPIDIFVFLAPKNFATKPLDYHATTTKSLASQTLLQYYVKYKPPTSQLWVITETDFSKRFQQVVAKIQALNHA